MTETTLGRDDEPQHSGAVVAVNYGDYRTQELWIRSGSNIGCWFPLGGEFGRPRIWDDPRTELQKLAQRFDPPPKPGPGEVPRYPRWEDVLARGPVTLLVAAQKETYDSGWVNGRRRLVEQIETLSEQEDPT